jgi:hypothetical protein
VRQGYFRSADVDRLLTIASNRVNNPPQQWQVGRRMRKDVTSSSTRPVVRAAVSGRRCRSNCDCDVDRPLTLGQLHRNDQLSAV